MPPMWQRVPKIQWPKETWKTSSGAETLSVLPLLFHIFAGKIFENSHEAMPHRAGMNIISYIIRETCYWFVYIPQTQSVPRTESVPSKQPPQPLKRVKLVPQTQPQTQPQPPPPPGTDYTVPIVHATRKDMHNFAKFVQEKIVNQNLNRLGIVKVIFYFYSHYLFAEFHFCIRLIHHLCFHFLRIK